jgi:hypothetical protein
VLAASPPTSDNPWRYVKLRGSVLV